MRFNYIARTSTGATQKGAVMASDQATAMAAIKQKGLIPVLIKAEGKGMGKKKLSLPFGKKKVKAKDIVIFTRQLATLSNAGVPIVKSLSTLKLQTESPYLHKILDDIAAKVEGGQPLSDSLEAYPKVFSPVYVNMVRAGEAGGILDQILERLAVQVEKDAEIKGRLKSAMIYPAVITTITFGAFFFIMTGIIPKLKSIFEDFGGQLPIQTRIMLGISDALLNYGLFLLIGAVVGIVLLVRLLRTPKGKRFKDRLLLRTPVFGMIIMKVNIARFSRTFSSLTSAGVSVLESLTVTAESLGNAVVEDGIRDAASKVKNGQSISSALEENHIFPPIIIQMTAVGEETGQVDKVLTKVAEFYEREVDTVIDGMTSIIEPLLIIVLGGMVGLIVASVFGPIAQLSNVVK